METKYAILADIHPAAVDKRQRYQLTTSIIVNAFKAIKEEKPNALILNGDILAENPSILFRILKKCAGNINTYIQPGSHEVTWDYNKMIQNFSQKYPHSFFDALKNKVIKKPDHTLVFLPGSDWNIEGANYIFTTDQNKRSGIKLDIETYNIIHYTNLNDLRDLVEDPENTIVVSHVPRHFDNPETCVDMAYFGENPKGNVLPGLYAKIANMRGDNFKIREENRGNRDLEAIFEELGITKAISNHFHESGHRANNLNSKHVNPETWNSELFYNSGCLTMGQLGILTVSDNKVKYKNISI